MSRIGISRGIFVWSLAIFLAQPAARAQEEKFGEVNFPISCSAAAQTQFNRAVAMLHSFFFPETVKAFTALAQQEPSCAMAYWGIAGCAKTFPPPKNCTEPVAIHVDTTV